MTVRMDNELKQTFDSLCSQFGMSANAAMNVFAKAVMRTIVLDTNCLLVSLPSSSQNVWNSSFREHNSFSFEANQIEAVGSSGKMLSSNSRG